MAFHFPKASQAIPSAFASRPNRSGLAAAIQHPLGQLPRDQDHDRSVGAAFGSLKGPGGGVRGELPTIRIRVDRVIERLRVIVAGRKDEGSAGLLAAWLNRARYPAGGASEEAVDMETGAQERASLAQNLRAFRAPRR